MSSISQHTRRLLVSIGAGAIMVGSFAPTAAAFTLDDVQQSPEVDSVVATVEQEVQTHVDNATQIAQDYIGDGVGVEVSVTNVNAYGYDAIVPLQAPAGVVQAANQIDGVEVTNDVFTAGIAPTAPETQRVENTDLAPGTEQVVSEGSEGLAYNINGVESTVFESQNRVVEYAPEVATAPVVHTPAPAPVQTAPSTPYGVWDSLAQCESGGNWSINTGNGYHGGLQFSPSTWNGYGGGQYAPYAYQATREQQIDIASRVQQGQGWGAWPACSSQLGLR